MENNQQQILSEIKSLMSSVRVQLEQLDAKMAQLQQMYEPQEFDMAPIEMDFDVVPEPVAEPEPSLLLEPEQQSVQIVPEQVQQTAPVAVIDVMATKHAWRTDMPGSPVKDVRAAIALVDRALFINALFDEDAMAFMESLNQINQAETFDAAVEYLAAAHPDWDFDSDVVYRFMMAVRRKING